MSVWARALPLAVICGGLAACGAGDAAGPVYRGVVTQSLDEDLVRFLVSMEDAQGVADVEDYARCAAARHTLRQGFSFARHVRTRVDEAGGLWQGDAIYTISPALPAGVRTIDAEVTVADCAERNIPTV